MRLEPAEKVRYQQQAKGENAYTTEGARAGPILGAIPTSYGG